MFSSNTQIIEKKIPFYLNYCILLNSLVALVVNDRSRCNTSAYEIVEINCESYHCELPAPEDVCISAAKCSAKVSWK